jgi:hypothetical protein
MPSAITDSITARKLEVRGTQSGNHCQWMLLNHWQRLYLDWDVTSRVYLATALLLKVTSTETDWLHQKVSYLEADSRSPDEQIIYIIWNTMFRYYDHRITPLELGESNPVSHYFKIHFYIILTSKPSSFKWSLPFRVSYHNCMRIYYFLYALSISSFLMRSS